MKDSLLWTSLDFRAKKMTLKLCFDDAFNAGLAFAQIFQNTSWLLATLSFHLVYDDMSDTQSQCFFCCTERQEEMFRFNQKKNDCPSLSPLRGKLYPSSHINHERQLPVSYSVKMNCGNVVLRSFWLKKKTALAFRFSSSLRRLLDSSASSPRPPSSSQLSAAPLPL